MNPYATFDYLGAIIFAHRFPGEFLGPSLPRSNLILCCSQMVLLNVPPHKRRNATLSKTISSWVSWFINILGRIVHNILALLVHNFLALIADNFLGLRVHKYFGPYGSCVFIAYNFLGLVFHKFWALLFRISWGLRFISFLSV